MRSHGTKKLNNKNNNKSEKDGGERSGYGYGLRVNPKKSSRISGSNDHDFDSSSEQEIFCQVCGKGFDSMRALFGHMRHHSGTKKKKEQIHCKKCGKEFESLRALIGHMKSHSSEKRFVLGGGVQREKLFGETSQLVRKKRSRRLLRYKAVSPNCSFSYNNMSECSSGVELLDHDKEVEEVAFCLLMLSRGVHSWDEFCSVAESSDNSESPNHIPGNGDGDGDGDDGWLELVKKPRLEMLELFGGKKVSDFSENDFGLGNDGEEKMVSLEASVSNGDTDYEKEKESEGGIGNINSVGLEFDENQREVVMVGVDLVSHSKKSEYKCRTCNKIFHSHQALGGHQTIHRLAKNSFPTFQFDVTAAQCSDFPGIEAEPNENSMEMEMEMEMDRVTLTSYESNTNNKEHKCPICFKVFASGQALGGHKRAHIVRDSEVEADQITLMKQEVCNISDVLDVGVSLTLEDIKANNGVQLKPWWVKNDHKHEVLVGLVPN